MKTKLFTLFLALVASVGTMYASVTIGGIAYNLNNTELTAEVTSGSTYVGHVNIPVSVTYDSKYYLVTSIGQSAFYGRTSLTSITIPNSVTSIGNTAFYGCTHLTSVTIPNSVTSVGASAFSGCSGLTSVTIPNSITIIREYAFRGCTSLTSITIPNSVTNIVGYAFYGCTGLTSITIPNSVIMIGDFAFRGCTGLTSLIIGNSVTSIGKSAFNGCTGLTSVTIPNSVTTIMMAAFMECSGLTSVSIGNSVKDIGSSAFNRCTGLTRVEITDLTAWCNIAFSTYEANPLYYAHHLYLNGIEVKNLVIPNSITSIRSYTFNGCSGLTSVTIPNSVTSIGESAFSECSGLTSIAMGNSITSIGKSAFNGCTSLTSITIPNSVTIIGNAAFVGCNNISTVIWNAKNCNTCNFGSQVTSFIFGDGVEVIPESLCSEMSNLTSITIPDSVTSIGGSAFNGCSGLTSVYISDIAAWCSVNFANSTSNPLYNAKHLYFDGTEITDLIIPNTVTAIGENAFYNCEGLTSVTIPNSVTSIGSTAFNGCSALTDIYATCGDIRRVRQLLNNDERVKYAPLPYSLSVNANNGSVGLPQNSCDVFELNAQPDYGYHFTQWSDGNTENPRQIILTQDTMFIAEFAPNIYSVSLTCDTSRGSIEGLQGELEYGTELTYTVTPKYGYHFVEWSDRRYVCDYSWDDECYGGHWEINSNPVRTIVIESDYTIEAIFAPNEYRLSSMFTPNGYVSGTGTYDYLTECTIKAIPNQGFNFVQWSDGNTENPRQIILTQDTMFIAEFAPNIYSVSLTCDTSRGSIEGPQGEFEHGSELTYTTTPKYGYHFDHWTNNTINKGEEYNIIAAFSVPEWCNDPYAWIWKIGESGHWEKLPLENGLYVYRTNATDEGIIIVPDGPDWSNGQTPDIYLTESTCYTIDSFDKYLGESRVSKGYDCFALDTLRINLIADTVIEAFFAPNKYTLSTLTNPNGSVSGTGTFDYLTECTFEAVPNYGYHFTQWSDGNTDNPRTIVLMQDTTFTALFVINTYLVQFFGYDNVLLDSQSVEHGAAAIAPEAPSVEHFDFVGWDKEFSNISSNVDVFAIYQQNTEYLDGVNIDSQPQKIMIDGQILILRGDRTYTITGQEVK